MLLRLIGCFAMLTTATAAEPYAVDTDASVFAVMTQRGGIAARFAHDHLITAADYEAGLEIRDGAVTAFEFRCEVEKLQVDDPDAKERWSDALEAAGLLTTPFKAIEADDRKTIREHMLDADQLDSETFPSIDASLQSVREEATEFKGESYTHVAKLAVTVHGETVTREIAANVVLDEDGVSIEAAGAFRFTEFGIEPYSAMLGAVKNQDEFFIYCSITAHAIP